MSNAKGAQRRGQMIEMHCPNCNKLVGTYAVGEYRYGSPLKVCPKCKTEYVNPVFHEIEIDGIAPESFDIKRLLIALVFGIFSSLSAQEYTISRLPQRTIIIIPTYSLC